MSNILTGIFWGLVVLGALLLGYKRGRREAREECADEAISDTTAVWWLEAVLDARNRRAKKALRAKA